MMWLTLPLLMGVSFAWVFWLGRVYERRRLWRMGEWLRWNVSDERRDQRAAISEFLNTPCVADKLAEVQAKYAHLRETAP